MLLGLGLLLGLLLELGLSVRKSLLLAKDQTSKQLLELALIHRNYWRLLGCCRWRTSRSSQTSIVVYLISHDDKGVGDGGGDGGERVRRAVIIGIVDTRYSKYF